MCKVSYIMCYEVIFLFSLGKWFGHSVEIMVPLFFREKNTLRQCQYYKKSPKKMLSLENVYPKRNFLSLLLSGFAFLCRLHFFSLPKKSVTARADVSCVKNIISCQLCHFRQCEKLSNLWYHFHVRTLYVIFAYFFFFFFFTLSQILQILLLCFAALQNVDDHDSPQFPILL